MENENQKIDLLAEALSKAQGEIKAPLKNRTVDFTDKNNRRVKYNYADLADVIEALRIPFSKNGLSIMHQLVQGEFQSGMVTTLLHSSGQKQTTFYPMPDPLSMRAQEFGALITYARRYSVSMIAGIASEEDDDGQIIPDPDPKKPKPPAQPIPKPTQGQPQITNGGLTEPQIKRLFTIADKRQWTTDQLKFYMSARWELESTKDLDREKYDALVGVVESKSYVQAITEIHDKMRPQE